MRVSDHLPLIIGVASGVGALVFVSGLVWILVAHRRRRNAKREWQKSLRNDLEKHRLDIQVVDSEGVFDVSLVESEKHQREELPEYRGDRYTSRPQPNARTRRSAQGTHAVCPPAYDPRVSSMKQPRGFSSGRLVPSNITHDASYDSSDSASMYSTASAPLSLRDQFPQAQSSPLTSLRTSTGRVMYVPPHQMATARAPTAYINPLAPETYDKTFPRPRGSMIPIPAKAPIRISYAESLLREQRARAAEKLPPHLQPSLVPPSPSARRSRSPLLYHKVSQSTLPSPYSPPRADIR